MSGPTIRLKISGVENFEKSLRQLPEILQKRIVLQGFRAGAEEIMGRAKELAPTDNLPQTKGGRSIKDSIRIVRPGAKALRENREIIYSVKTRHPLAVIAEYGTAVRQRLSGGSTGTMPAFAFMRRAVDEGGAAAIDAIAQKCRALLDAALAKMPKGK